MPKELYLQREVVDKWFSIDEINNEPPFIMDQMEKVSFLPNQINEMQKRHK